MQIKKAPVKDLVSPEWNPRQITNEELEKLKTSLEEFGYIEPIIVNDVNNHVVGGNQRLRALIALGYDEVDCVYVHIEDLAKEKACNVALNKISGDWDNDKLKIVLEEIELSPIDVSLTGFDEIELTEFKVEEIESEYLEQPPEIIEDNYQDENIEVTVEEGDLYQLGNHRLYCGDATKQESYSILTNKKEMDLVFTDPPYGLKKEKDGVQNDNLNYDDLLEFNKQWIPLTFNTLTEVGSWYCWGFDEPLMDIYAFILKPMKKNNEITFRNYITWAKHMAYGINAEPMRQYPTETEKCLFVMKGVQGFNTNADNYWEEWEPIRKYLEDSRNIMGWTDEEINKITGVTTCARHYFNKSQWTFPTREHYLSLQKEAEKQLKERGKKDYDAFKKDYDALKKDYDALKKDYDALKKEWYSTRAYFNNTHNDPNQDEIMTDVWRFSTTSITERESCGDHATPKPLRLCARAILSSSRENENVLDVFGGSGSTLIACEQLNRNCYMMELDPYYCQVIINRWEQYTGEKAEKIN